MSRRQLMGLRLLITGASQGIGRELVIAAVDQGCQVLAVARNTALLEELAASVRARHPEAKLEVVTADVSTEAGRQAMLEAAQSRFNGMDVLVNNAGFGASGPFVETELQTLRDIFETNYFGLIELIRLFLPILRQGTTPAVVNISSILGKRAWPARSFYSSSKYAVQGFSDALRVELAPLGVDVIVICPGLTNTNFPKNMRENKATIPLNHKRGMSPQRVAEVTLEALAAGRDEVHLTFLGKLFLFVNRIAPRLVDRIARRKIRSLYAEEIAERERYRDAARQAGR